MTFDKELNKKSVGELYYGKENLMAEEKLGMSITREKAKRYHIELSSEQGKLLTEVANRMDVTLSLLVKLLLQNKYMALKQGKAPVVCLMIDKDKPIS